MGFGREVNAVRRWFVERSTALTILAMRAVVSFDRSSGKASRQYRGGLAWGGWIASSSSNPRQENSINKTIVSLATGAVVVASKVTILKDKFLGSEVDSGSVGTRDITGRIAIALDAGLMYFKTRPTKAGERGKITGRGQIRWCAGHDREHLVRRGGSDGDLQDHLAQVSWQ